MNRGISDRRDTPIGRMVVFGESHTVGVSATRPELGWAEILKGLIDTFQTKPVELVNRGLGADILSAACPLYPEYEGKRPIGIERYHKHVIDEQPDLIIVSFGYNDIRAGTPLAAFRSDFETMIKAFKAETEALIVVLNTYAILGEGYTNKSGGTIAGSAWDKGTRETQTLYNLMLHDVSEDQGVIFSDIYSSQVRAPWTFCSPDGTADIHANDLGHRLIANRIFEDLATRCSFLSIAPQAARKKTGKSPWRYGPKSEEAKLIADFYPSSPALDTYKKKPSKRALK